MKADPEIFLGSAFIMMILASSLLRSEKRATFIRHFRRNPIIERCYVIFGKRAEPNILNSKEKQLQICWNRSCPN